jgi:hypothetical protein
VYEDEEEFDEWNEEGEEEQEGGGGPMGGMQGGYPHDYQRAILEEMMRHQAQMARTQNELMSQLSALMSQVPGQKPQTRGHAAFIALLHRSNLRDNFSTRSALTLAPVAQVQTIDDRVSRMEGVAPPAKPRPGTAPRARPHTAGQQRRQAFE